MSTQGSIKRDDSGMWFFVVDIAGTDNRRKQLRRRGFRTKGDAQQALTKVLGDVQRGSFVKPTKQTVEVFLTEWIETIRPTVRASTWASYVSQHANPRDTASWPRAAAGCRRGDDLASLYRATY